MSAQVVQKTTFLGSRRNTRSLEQLGNARSNIRVFSGLPYHESEETWKGSATQVLRDLCWTALVKVVFSNHAKRGP